MNQWTGREHTRAKAVTTPMTAWAEFADCARITVRCASGPLTLDWLCQMKAKGATKVGYRS